VQSGGARQGDRRGGASRSGGLVAVLIVAALCLGGAASAEAREPTERELEEAQQRFQRATELFEENNVTGALAEFRRAYALAPNYRVLYNIGQLCVLTHDASCAYSAFSDYLEQGAGEIPAGRREEVQRELSRLERRVARLRILVDRPGAEVTVDDVSVGMSPLPKPVLVAAGRYRVRAALQGNQSVIRVVEVAGMETAQVELLLGAPVRPDSAGAMSDHSAGAPRASGGQSSELARPSAGRSGSSLGVAQLAGIGLVVVGAAGVAGGVIAGLEVRSTERKVEKAGLGQLGVAARDDLDRRGHRYEVLQWVGYGVGGAALVSGLLLIALGGHSDAEYVPELTATFGPGSAQLGLAGRF
jgi:hypothetical protein